MPARYDNVRSIFEEAQRGLQHSKKLLTELKKLHDNSTQDEFQEGFLLHLKHAMVVFNRESTVERVIEFAAKYVTLKEHNVPAIQKVISLDFDIYRSCHFDIYRSLPTPLAIVNVLN